MKILSKQNFNQNESKNFVVDNLSSAPSNPILGQVYYNTQNERAYVCIKSGETPEWADLSLQEEVSIGREEPNGRDIKIWINPEDMASSSDYGSLPIGSIIPYSGETAPEGYSICDGKELNRETYKELFSIIGTTFGNGDDTSTFNLPDLKGRISVGLDSSDTDFDTLGKTGGKKTHTLTIDEIPAHTHNLTYNTSGAGANTGGTVALGNTSTTTLFATLPTGGSKEHNNLQPYIVLNYIIKIYGEAMLTGDVIDSLEGDSSYNAPSIHAVNTKIKELEAYSSTAINEGSEITLAPNPNPNYNPIDIQIDGKSEQTTTKGNQLLDFSKYDSSSSATMTLTFENDVLTTTCIASGPYMNFTWIITDLIKANPGKTLSFTFDKYDASQATDSSVNLQIYTGSNVSYFGLVRADGTSVPYTIPEDVSNISTVNFRILPNNLATPKASTLVITKPMLQFGTEKLDYEPYTGGQPSPSPDYPQEIKSVEGIENLFDKNKYINLTSNGITATITQDYINVKGTATANAFLTWQLPKIIKSGTVVTMSANNNEVSTSPSTFVRLCYDELFIEDAITRIPLNIANNSKTFTTTHDDDYLQIRVNSGDVLNINLKIQIEKGSVSHDYVPYGHWLEVKTTSGEQEQSTLIDMNKYDSDGNITGYYELSSIGDTKDILTIQNGQATINQKIGKVVLDGSENWNNDGGTQGTDYRHNIYYASRMSIPIAKGTNGTFLSNYFTPRNDLSNSGELGTFYMSNVWLVFVDKNKVYDLAQWKTWLSTHNTEVYYVLAEPQTITLNGSYDIELFEGTNNITTTDELQPNMKIEYYTDVMGNPGVIPDYDGLPVGSEIDFDGTSTDIPTGWEETTDPESYSTDEVKTNKTWIDGKPIYRKVVDLGFLGTQTQISYGNQIDIMTSFGGYLYQDNGENMSLIEYTSSLWRAITYKITSHHTMNVLINRSDTFAWSDWKLKIVIEYTKTTD